MTEETTSTQELRDRMDREIADELFIVPPRVMRFGLRGCDGFVIAWEIADTHNQWLTGAFDSIAFTLGQNPEDTKIDVDEADEEVRSWLESRNCQKHRSCGCGCEADAKWSAEFVLLLREIWPLLDGKIAKIVADNIVFRRDIDAHRALQSAIKRDRQLQAEGLRAPLEDHVGSRRNKEDEHVEPGRIRAARARVCESIRLSSGCELVHGRALERAAKGPQEGNSRGDSSPHEQSPRRPGRAQEGSGS